MPTPITRDPANVGFGGEGGGNRATSILSRKADYGNVYGTRRLRWNTTGLYDLPFGRGKLIGANVSRARRRRDWRLAAVRDPHHADGRLHHAVLPQRDRKTPQEPARVSLPLPQAGILATATSMRTV